MTFSNDKFLRRSELPAVTGLSYHFFKKAAVVGNGPRFTKVGKAALYRLSDVISWIEKHATKNKEVAND